MPTDFERISGPPFAVRSEVLAPHGMVATSQPLATQIGVEILKSGGSATDAAIAANAALGLMEPTGCGIGGELFAMVWDEGERRLWGLNASGRSPGGLSLEHFRQNGFEQVPATGPLPVSVPGTVDGWFRLHQRFGRLPMRQLLRPAIEYAQDGFPVSEVIANVWAANARLLQDYPGFAETFMPGGRPPAKGELFRNSRLAETYARIAAGGRDAFYRGEIADAIGQYMRANGGFLSADDLAAHESEWVEPVSTEYRGHRVWELPPNGQGITVLQMLNILEGFDLTAMGFGSADYLHCLIEAKKLAFEDRARWCADPQFTDLPLEMLISKAYGSERRELIEPDRAAPTLPSADPEHGDTVYLSVGDRDGNMVSLIQSNYLGMGSGMTPGDLGFVLQNRGQLFSLEPGHPNVFAPGKRPFNTIIPAFVTVDGQRRISFGVMGGAMQPQGQTQIIVNMLDFGLNLQAAGDAPRVRHTGSSQPTGESMTDGGTVYLERGIGGGTRAELRVRGHRIGDAQQFFGGYQAVMWDAANGTYVGASESRTDGQAAGY
jgi:gamma-glutamyltranspeptidase/glutathione hydrolase